MVKVQKPQPKSLSKSASIEGVAKKKKTTEKGKLAQAAVLEVAAPIKKGKNAAPKKVDVTEKPKKEQKKPVEKEKQQKAAKRPLVIAPPESPAASPVAVKKSKGKAAAIPATPAAKKPLILAPSPSPAKPAPAKKEKKGKPAPVEAAPKKSNKKSTVEEAPAKIEAPAKKAAAGKKVDTVSGKKADSASAKKAVETPAPTAPKKDNKKAAPAKKTEAAPAKKTPEVPAKKAEPAKKAAAAKKTVEAPTKTAAPAKKAAAAKKLVEALAKKSEKASKQTTKAVPAVAETASKISKPATASLQAKTKPLKKLSKPDKSPKAKKAGKKIATLAKGKSNKKAKKPKKKPVALQFELKPFDEQKFRDIVSESNVLKMCQALKTQAAEEVAKKKSASVFSDYRYILQVCSYKIPSCPKRVVKLGLKHSLVGSDDDVAIIVTDLQRGAKFDFEPTKAHYEDLFSEIGIKQRLTVVPFNQLRNDVNSFEAKRKFLNTYDYLMCDGKLSGQASAFLGKFTQKPRNVLHPVRLSKDNAQLQRELSRALCRTAYRQLSKGDLTAIPVGNHEHSAEQLAENILLVTKQLETVYPGGLANIRSLYVKIDIVGTSALPLYISMCAAPADTPYVVGPREQRMLKLKKQANEVLSRFALTKDAEFVKLTWQQVKRKAEIREEKAALLAADAAGVAAPSKENDGEDTVVPTKKARKESTSEAAKNEAESDDDEVDEADSGEDEGDEDDESDEEVDDDDSDDDDDE
ncbi:ribosomal L1 domain-containing protein CG13096 isoform X2 [Drosophila obscura]|uniref:ribosomal L1 domain-containing protein CG13096 isoform X2 n=1 Tax=Drosophila obscura TaxID=7282 RepID=UPI001BB11595|nr:ribosomal L1 domain-containing protein CG13096 isoform X2 [Drosophila obscura]